MNGKGRSVREGNSSVIAALFGGGQKEEKISPQHTRTLVVKKKDLRKEMFESTLLSERKERKHREGGEVINKNTIFQYP
jgi:hypothetical protein